MKYDVNTKLIENKIDSNILKMIEKYFNINFPKSYKEFILNCNGGEPKRNMFTKKETNEGYKVRFFLGFVPDSNHSIMDYYKTYSKRIPSHMFPIAYDSFGNLFLISLKNPDREKIYFWDHEMEADDDEEPNYSNLTLLSDSFEAFMEDLYEDTE